MNSMVLQDEIKKMIDLIEENIDTPANLRRQGLWDEKGLPLKDSPKIPVTVNPEISMWCRLFEVSLVDFYQVPEVYVYAQLKSKLFAFDNFNDDKPLDRSIWMWFGTPFEGSLFGLPFEFLEYMEPEDGGAVLYEDCLEASSEIQQPDFFTSGMMPLAHRMYEECSKLLPDDYDIDFPDYIQTPAATAAHLLGIEHFLMQCVTEPQGIKQLLSRLLGIRVQYRRDRAQFLDGKLEPGIYDNDIVGIPLVSPQFYQDVIWPIENEMAIQEGGINYWHSCGNTTAFHEFINKLPAIGLRHISAWTDRQRAAEAIHDNDAALQVCVHPLEEVIYADDSKIEESITEIIETLGNHRIKIEADCLQAHMDLPEQINRIQNWIAIAQKITS